MLEGDSESHSHSSILNPGFAPLQGARIPRRMALWLRVASSWRVGASAFMNVQPHYHSSSIPDYRHHPAVSQDIPR
jgi:hypothetical protein